MTDASAGCPSSTPRPQTDPTAPAALGDLALYLEPDLLPGLLSPRPGIPELSADRTPVSHEDLEPTADRPGVRVYRPASAPTPTAGLLFVHGGGFVMGSPEVFDRLCDHYARELGVVVVSPRYRLAPAHPFPAALDDVHAALNWFTEEAVELGVDAGRIGLSGTSAGATITAGVALLARDSGGPAIRHLSLQSPCLDDRHETLSSRQVTDPRTWNRETSIRSWRSYLGGAVDGEVPAYAAPARAQDLSGLPPTFLSTGQWEVFRDETLEFGKRLAGAGVPTELHVYPGAWHGFEIKAPQAAVSRASLHAQVDALRRALRHQDEPATTV